MPVPKSIISSNLKGITVSAPPGTIKPGLPSVVLLNLYPPKSLFNIHHYYTKSIKYFFFIINLYSDLGGFSFKEEAGIKYVRGADSVWVPFSSIAYIANFKGKYGTGNNSVISATPEEIQGYKLALYGFTNLYASGAMHVAAISADNNHVQAGSQYGSVISATYGGYFVKTGTPYIIKEHSLVKTSTVNLSNNVPGYRLVGGVLHFSDYSSSQTGGAAIGNLAMDNSSDIIIANVLFQYSAVTVSAKLLYLPG